MAKEFKRKWVQKLESRFPTHSYKFLLPNLDSRTTSCDDGSIITSPLFIGLRQHSSLSPTIRLQELK